MQAAMTFKAHGTALLSSPRCSSDCGHTAAAVERVGRAVGSELALALALQKMVEFANKVNGNLYTEQNTSGQLWIAGRALGIGTGEVSSAVRSAMSTA